MRHVFSFVLLVSLLAVLAYGQVNLSGGGILFGTSSAIGGGLLTVATCASGTVNVAGASTGMAVSGSPVTYPGDGIQWQAYVSSAGVVTIKVCAMATLTPTSSVYNVRVIQ